MINVSTPNFNQIPMATIINYISSIALSGNPDYTYIHVSKRSGAIRLEN